MADLPHQGELCTLRRPGEALYLTLPDGRQVRIRIGPLMSRSVRLFVQAPDDVKISREERTPTPKES